jgi:hypothetical protein
MLLARAKVERAKAHVENLKAEIRAFRNLGPYVTAGSDEPDTGDRVVRLLIGEPIPVKLALIFGDAIHNLRSSLDHVARRLSLACGGKPNRTTAFPIFENAPADIEAEIARKIPSARPNIIRLIKLLEPYKGGKGDILWRLHQLDIIDKHRLPVTVGTCNDWITIRGVIPIQALFPHVKEPKRGFPPAGLTLENGYELVRVKAAERKADYQDPQFNFQVALDEVFKGKPLVPAIEQLVDEVSRLLDVLSPLLI